jgi:glutamyl-tRNA reductase
MPFLAIGVEHKTAPLSIREPVALEGDTLEQTYLTLATEPAIAEVAILSTCNRTEVYLVTETEVEATAVVSSYLAGTDDKLRPYLQIWRDMEAVEHLFRVASGLESKLLGEAQILSQVREVLETGQRLATIGANLHALFRSAISCARQARAGTALGRINLSLGVEAVRAARHELGTLQDRTVLLIGGGEIGRLIGEELARQHLKVLFVANRTAITATELAARYGGQAALFSDIPRLIPHVDVIFSATSAPQYVLTRDDVESAGHGRRDTPLTIFDLAIPRDVDPMVGDLPNVSLHDLDSVLPAGLVGHWEDDIRSMESVIAAEIQEFLAWHLTRRVVPVIANLRSHVEAVSQQELKRIAPQLANLTDRERAAVDSLTQRLIDKMFHHLVMRLRLAAQTDPKLVDAAEFFFLHGEGSLFEHAANIEDEAGVTH